MAPNMPTVFSWAGAKPGFSTSPRPSPVNTLAEPAAARTRSASCAVDTPSSGSTAIASAFPGWPDSRPASAFSNQAPGVRAASTPATSKDPAPAGLVSVTVSPRDTPKALAVRVSSTVCPGRGVTFPAAPSPVASSRAEEAGWPSRVTAVRPGAAAVAGKTVSATASDTSGSGASRSARPVPRRTRSGICCPPTNWSAATTTGAGR